MSELEYVVAKAMTRNKLRALEAAVKRPRELRGSMGHSNARVVPDRVARDAAYAKEVLARHREGRRGQAAVERIERTRRDLAASGGQREWNGGGTWRSDTDRRWRSAKNEFRGELRRVSDDAAKPKANAARIANDQRLKPRRLP